MAVFKTLRKKEKEFVFTAYQNDRDEKPAKVIFARFPLPQETFSVGKTEWVFKDIDFKDAETEEGRQHIYDTFLDNFYANITARKIDIPSFIKECVVRFEDFFFEDREIKKPADFLKLPDDFVEEIASECYDYAASKDEFTTGELPA